MKTFKLQFQLKFLPMVSWSSWAFLFRFILHWQDPNSCYCALEATKNKPAHHDSVMSVKEESCLVLSHELVFYIEYVRPFKSPIQNVGCPENPIWTKQSRREFNLRLRIGNWQLIWVLLVFKVNCKEVYWKPLYDLEVRGLNQCQNKHKSLKLVLPTAA